MQKISTEKEKKEFNNIEGKMESEMKKSVLGNSIHNTTLKNRGVKEILKKEVCYV